MVMHELKCNEMAQSRSDDQSRSDYQNIVQRRSDDQSRSNDQSI